MTRRSPDGSVEVVYAEDTVGHHTISEPAVYRVRDGALLLNLQGTMLDSRPRTSFPAPGRVRLELRKYPVGSVVAYDLVVDVEAETFGMDGAEPDRPLAELPDVVRELRATIPEIRAADLAAARCPACGGHLRRFGTSAFDTTQPFECVSCGSMW